MSAELETRLQEAAESRLRAMAAERGLEAVNDQFGQYVGAWIFEAEGYEALTVGQLRSALEGLPDDLKVESGYYIVDGCG